MAFGTAGSSGGGDYAVLQLLDRLLEIMSEPKVAKEYLVKLKAEREANQKLLDVLATERAAFIAEKTAYENEVINHKRALAEQEGFLKKQEMNWEARVAGQKAEIDKLQKEAAKTLADAEVLRKDYERRLAMIREAAA